MRTAFVQTLCGLAEQDDRIWLLCGDLGYSVLECFAERFPDRFVNAGVAEQNMTGMAAGLALSGKIVFTYSIANFPTLRCLEQIRNDVCYHNLDVKIVAVGGGLAYGPQGYTHHGVEDLAIMRVLPHMTVLAPGDPVETRLATSAMVAQSGPCYLRLGKAGEPIVHQSDPQFQIGRSICVRSGTAATVICTGGLLQMAMQSADKLADRGCDIQVMSMHTVQPLDEEAVRHAARSTRGIITLEEHGVGGLGTAVAEVLAVMQEKVPFIPLRLPGNPVSHAGSQATLRTAGGLSVERIIETVLTLA